MPYTDAGLDAAVNGIASAGARITFHTADPGTTGASEVSGTGRPATTWAAASASSSPVGRQRVGTQVSAPIPAGTTVTHWGVSTAASGGTFLYGGALDAPETFGSAGTILHTPTIVVTN
jgi:hypothetical protein